MTARCRISELIVGEVQIVFRIRPCPIPVPVPIPVYNILPKFYYVLYYKVRMLRLKQKSDQEITFFHFYSLLPILTSLWLNNGKRS